MRRTTLTFAIALSLLGLPCLAGPALAGFSLCNKTGLAVRAEPVRIGGMLKQAIPE